MARCVVLLSGGLDSMLAVRIMQEQGIEVEALNFKTIFTCCQDESGQAARKLGVRLTVIGQEDDYLDLIRQPKFGFGRGANPCVDCRIYMFQRALSFMEQIDADFIVSGEVLGQRPMSQKRRDLEAIAYHSAAEDLLLRPLSAKLLPPTRPERDGIVDRQRLYDFTGRSRKGLIALARRLGLTDIPAPSTGCALTEVPFSRKVFDLVKQRPEANRWEFELLKTGRHFRFDANTKVVVGRRESENAQMEYLHQLPEAASSALLLPANFRGACTMIVGPLTDDACRFAGGLALRYGKPAAAEAPRVRVIAGEKSWTMEVAETERSATATTIADG